MTEKSAKKIKEICDRHESCDNCPFSYFPSDIGCGLAVIVATAGNYEFWDKAIKKTGFKQREG